MAERSSHVDPRAVELFVEYLDRVQAGERLEFETFCRDHADHAAALRSLKDPWDAAQAVLERVHPAAPLTRRLLQRFVPGSGPALETGEPRAALPERVERAGEDSALIEHLRREGPRGSRYRRVGEVAHGGMGVILKVWDEDLRRAIAMKLLIEDRDTSTSEPSSSSARTIGRFLEEAQVTGQLDHPGIVPVHELGLSADGRVYFTMRLVKGDDLRAIFGLVREEQDGWTVTRALGVMLKVCEAMSYAHAKGVIHRDLKPANVMVGRFGEVYVMDWGLARVLGQPDRHDLRLRPASSVSIVRTDRHERREDTPDSPLVTMDGDVVGTPSYMSPEQARGELERLGPRSDVYSLGAMLYQLLGREAPYAPRGVRVSSRTILARVIAGPPTPLEDLAPDTPAELTAICEKAMAREPADRYRDMAELAEDLRAFLEHRVVAAYETGAWAEARKWVHRNRPLAATLAAALAILLAGLAASTTQYVRAEDNYAVARVKEREAALHAEEATREAARAQREADRANELARSEADQRIVAELLQAETQCARDELERRALELQQVSDFQASMLGAVDLELMGARLREDVLKELRTALERSKLRPAEVDEHVARVESALAGTNFTNAAASSLERNVVAPALEAIQREFADQPLVRAQLLHSAGVTLVGLGRADAAVAALTRAYELRRDLGGGPDAGVIASMIVLGTALRDAGRLEDAGTLLREAAEQSVRFLGPDHDDTIDAKNNLALVYQVQGRLPEAEALLRDVLERSLRAFGEDGENTLMAANNLATVLGSRGRHADAQPLLRDVLERRRRLQGDDHPDTLTAENNLAALLRVMGRPNEGEPLLRDALERRRRLQGDDHPETLIVENNLAVTLHELGRLDEAEALFRHAWERRRVLFGDDHPDTLGSVNTLAQLLQDRGKASEAEPMLRDTLERRRRVLGEDHPQTLTSMNNLGLALRDLGRFDEAEPILRETLDRRRRTLGDEHPSTLTSVNNLGLVLRALKRNDEAEPLYREALEVRRRTLGADHPNTLNSANNLAHLLWSQGKLDEAEALFRDALERRRRALGEEHPSTLASIRNLGSLLIERREFEAAETLLLDGEERCVRAGEAAGTELRSTRRDLAKLYDAWEKHTPGRGFAEKAERYRALVGAKQE